MKPAYEHIAFEPHCSVRIYHRRLPRIPFEWHHHPEYELTLTRNSQGQRYIGDAIADYRDQDLVLVPPDLPHTWASNRSIDNSAPQVAIVIWFAGDWARQLADVCPEYAPLRQLLRRAGCGLAFEPAAAAAMQAVAPDLLASTPRTRLAATLDILCMLAQAAAEPLASPSAFKQRISGPSGHEPERINRVLSLIESRFASPLRLAELCAAASMSERSLSRYFEQHLGSSIVKYITRVRIGHACRLLASSALPVAVVAARSGFPNVSHFNRQFKTIKALTPAAYRSQFAATGIAETDANVQLTERSPSLQGRSRRPLP